MLNITRRRSRHAAAMAAMAAIILTLSACSGTAGQEGQETTPAASEAPSSEAAAVSVAPAQSSAPARTSGASSSAAAGTEVKLEDPKEVAVTAMELFARPDEPERRWFFELRPYLEDEYAVDAEYIDPARIPFDKIVSGPVMGGDSDNPQVALATFNTNAGPWYVELHQNVPGGDWLVGGIGSADE